MRGCGPPGFVSGFPAIFTRAQLVERVRGTLTPCLARSVSLLFLRPILCASTRVSWAGGGMHALR